MEREIIIKRVVQTLCIILALCLAGLYIGHEKQEEIKERKIAKLHEQAYPYEQELKQIEAELNDLREGIRVANETGMLVIGYQISNTDDFAFVEDSSWEYGFTPIVVIDLAGENPDVLLELAKQNYDFIVLTASAFTEDIRESLKQYRKTYGITYFLLRNTEDTEENIQLLKEAGFQGCARFSEASDNGVLDNGLACTNYSFIKSDSFSITSRMNELEKGKQSLLFVFDLSSDKLAKEAVVQKLEQIKAQVDAGTLISSTLSDIDDSIRKNSEATQSKRMTYEQYAEGKIVRMQELEDIIDEIYSHWDGDES